jgi:molybdopterin-guanine dinucleotide biosynthesis protein A
LGGILSELSAAYSDWGLGVACDMPFLNIELLTYLNSLREWYEAVVPVLKSRPEPTHPLYSKKGLTHIEQRLKPNDLKISRFYQDVRVKYVPEEDIARIDPDFLSFFNVNTPGDLNRAQALISAGR